MSFISFAQSKAEKKASEVFARALQAYDLSEYDKALEYSMEALKHTPEFDQPYLLMADIYRQKGEKQHVVATLTKLISLKKDIPCHVYLMLAKMEQETGAYGMMGQHLALYEFCDAKLDSDREQFELLRKSCEFALEAVKNPVDFSPENMGEAINSEYSEYLPCMTIDGESILFTRRLPVDKETGWQEDFFISYRQDGAWSAALPLDAPINTEYNEGAGTISADGRILIFTACAFTGKEYGAKREGHGSCDLFYSIREGDWWRTPQNMGGVINSIQWEAQPSLSADGRSLYFIRGDRMQAHSGDIYVSHLQKNNSWGKPQRLPNNINSPGKEHSVFIHPDGKTLYFSSNGHPGMGGFDIFMTTKLSDSTWSDPVNLGYPVNTHNDETSIFISGEGRYGYFASERPDGFGRMDIYRFELPEQIRPETVSYLQGKVFDKETLEPLLARFELIDTENGEITNIAYSDKTDGTFLAALPPHKNYALNVSAPEYLFYSDNFQMKENTNALKPFIKEIPLQRIAVGESVVLRNIFFDFDKSELKPESQSELLKLWDFLQKNPAVQIEISGHTDNMGDEAYNRNLSEARAKAVRDFLVSKGTDASRLSYKGYGVIHPVESNDTEEGRAANRRTEFKIIKK